MGGTIGSGELPSNTASIGSTGLADTGGGTGNPAGVEGTAIGVDGADSDSATISSSISGSTTSSIADSVSIILETNSALVPEVARPLFEAISTSSTFFRLSNFSS